MRGKYKLVRANKDHDCTEASWHRIRKGDTYLRGDCPPEHEMNDSDKWRIIRACIRCAKLHGMLDSDMRKQLGVQV